MIVSRRKSSFKTSRAAYSLLELVIAMTLLSVVMTATTVVLRTARQAWEAHEADHVRIRTAHSAVRHIIRQVRDAAEVVSVTNSRKVSSTLSVRMNDGDQLTWKHDAKSKRILFTQTSVSKQATVLAEGIETLEFRPVRVDQTAYDSRLNDRVQELFVLVGVKLPREKPVVRTAMGVVWLRPFGRNRAG